jgi:hypothetical protein
MDTSYNAVVVKNYFNPLRSLSREDKINLVAMLTNEIARETETKVENKDVVNRFFGAFQSDKSAEEMIDEIRSSRKFNRKIVSF